MLYALVSLFQVFNFIDVFIYSLCFLTVNISIVIDVSIVKHSECLAHIL